VTDWIPTDPNTYLDPIAGSPPADWEREFANWRFCYGPAFLRLAQNVRPGINGSNLIKELRPLVPLAVELIPLELKSAVHAVQPDDWSELPDDQIRRAINGKNMGFSKLILCIVSLQILQLVRTGKAGPGISIGAPPVDKDRTLEVLANFKDANAFNAVKELKLQLAVYVLGGHDPDFWDKEVIKKLHVAQEFKSRTFQKYDEFLQSFAKGEPVTFANLQLIHSWAAEKFKPKVFGQIQPILRDINRTKAAQRERVQEIKKASAIKTS
jgi:hypothetical protein